MKLLPIAHDTQIEDLLCGNSKLTEDSVKLKIAFTLKNADKIIAINGTNVYHPIVQDNCIYYSLSKGKTSQNYYYPIQYAEIVFFDNKP